MRPRWPGRSTIWLRPNELTPSAARRRTKRSSGSASRRVVAMPCSMRSDPMRRGAAVQVDGVHEPAAADLADAGELLEAGPDPLAELAHPRVEGAVLEHVERRVRRRGHDRAAR